MHIYKSVNTQDPLYSISLFFKIGYIFMMNCATILHLFSYFLLRLSSHHIKLTILKYTIQRYLVHLQCCATTRSVYCLTTSIYLQHIFPITEGNPAPSSSTSPPLPGPGDPASAFCLYVCASSEHII